jgi:hypothetical protein
LTVAGGGVKPNHSRLDKYEQLLLATLDRYPSGLIFMFLASQYERAVGNVDGSIQYLEKILVLARKKIDVSPKFVQSELAQCYFLNRAYPNVCQV